MTVLAHAQEHDVERQGLAHQVRIRSRGLFGTVEDAMERLYFLAKVEEGLRQAETGQTVDAEEAKRRILG